MTDISYRSKDGLTLYAKSYGSETADLNVLCMHGLTRNHKDFEPMIDALIEKGVSARFIAVDVRGRGQSDRDTKTENYTPLVYAGDMVDLLDHLGISETVLIGTSMGGLMSMVMMSMIPDRILGVVLNDIGPVLEQKGLDRISGYVGENIPKPDLKDAAKGISEVQASAFPGKSAEFWFDFAKRTYRLRDDGLFELDYDPEIARSIGEVKPTFFTKLAMWKLFKAMKKVPLLLVRGGLSDLLSEKIASKMIRKHGHAKLATVPNVGHAPILNEPEALNAIKDFLKTVERN